MPKLHNSPHNIPLALMVTASLINFSPAAYAQNKTLIIENNTPLPLKVYLDSTEDRLARVIGIVDPVSIKPMNYNLELGRWYVQIKPYSPNVRYKNLKHTLYVKDSQQRYVIEVLSKHFSSSPILPVENVSILGRWQAKSGAVMEFKDQGEFYIGKLLKVPERMRKLGYYEGMDHYKVYRMDFNRYKGTITGYKSDGSIQTHDFSCSIENGNELFLLGWKRIE